ncbi:MAG: 2-amino-4-hydroxy-6-hydroxymethyldihydropteridine diphosphokinase [Candidatus Dormibacteria bacterium]
MACRALLALGSNLGPRERNLDAAWAHLAAAGVRVLAATPRWNTAPIGAPPQPDYLNQLLLADGRPDPWGWLAAAQAAEGERSRLIDKGPRRLDVDVILVEGEESSDPRLQLPHPALLERPYLLLGAALLVPRWKAGRGGREILEIAGKALPPDWCLDLQDQPPPLARQAGQRSGPAR